MNFLENKVKSVNVTASHLTVELLDGRELRVPISLFPTLAEATPRQRNKWQLCGAGTGIHWPMLDYHLSVEGLVRREPEAPGIRRAKKLKYPAHRSGKAHALAENIGSSRRRRAASPRLKS